MNSSGIKRGLATTAVAALAVTGLPFLATSASAEPLADTYAPTVVDLLAPQSAIISNKNDGTNTTVSLVASGGEDVGSVQFLTDAATPGVFVVIPGAENVGRNADGVFKFDWAAPQTGAYTIQVLADTDTTDTQAVTFTPAAETVELGSEGTLGAFTSPYTESPGVFIGVTGTTSNVNAPVTVENRTLGGPAVSVGATEVDSDDDVLTTAGTFSARLNIAGYDATGDPDQIVLGAENAQTDDAEASTLRNQTIQTLDASPASQNLAAGENARIVLTVTDTLTAPVAGAQVYRGDNPATPAVEADALVGYTDGKGQIVDAPATAGTYVYFVNTTDADEYNANIDPTDTAVVTAFAPTLNTVDIINERSRSSFDLDEFSDDDTTANADLDEFSIETRDQGNSLRTFTGDVEYRYVIDSDVDGVPTVTTDWETVTVSGTAGTYLVPGPTDDIVAGDLPASATYTLEARAASGQVGQAAVSAVPEVFDAAEAEIVFADGNNANAPLNGEYSVTGKLALADGTGLAGREVLIDYNNGGNSAVAPQAQQPAGTTFVDGATAKAITDANGNFTVVLTDPDFPAVAENGSVVTAIANEAKDDATTLQNINGPDDSVIADDPANAEADTVVNFVGAPAVDEIRIIDTDVLDPRFNNIAGPGVPVDFDFEVYGVDPTPNNGSDDRVKLQDADVTVSIDGGAFLSPNADQVEDLTLTADNDDQGDLWGFFQNDGATDTVSTGDDRLGGFVAAIERNAGFDDDGLVTSVVTITAGGKTATRSITWDVRALLNAKNPKFTRASGEPANPVSVDEDVDFDLTVEDQFGNLAGDTFARINDNSTVADFRTDEDADTTLTDFTTSGTGVTAFSDAPATQILTATMRPGEVLVDANENPDVDFTKVVTVNSDEIVWVAAPVDPTDPTPTTRVRIEAKLFGKNFSATKDRLVVNAPAIAEGATVRLFKVVAGGKRVQVGNTRGLNAKGDVVFTVRDRNGGKITRYVATVARTARTFADTTNPRKVR